MLTMFTFSKFCGEALKRSGYVKCNKQEGSDIFLVLIRKERCSAF